MKKLLLTLSLALAITPAIVSAQSAAGSFGSALAPGGALFDVNSVQLFDSTQTIALSGVLAPTNDPFGAFGLVAGNIATTGIASDSASPWLSLDGGLGWFQLDSWSNFASASAPATPPINDFTVSGSGPYILQGAATVKAGGIAGAGMTIAVPEPSTYALLAGFAAFIFVAIRRRNS
jgi:hypothetical protein